LDFGGAEILPPQNVENQKSPKREGKA
jgi:hypothetical protein